ncbi:MAG: DUF3467 domain-containing protein [Planctomycetales bacterium]
MAGESGGSGSQPASPQRIQVEVNDSDAVSCYANFCRVTGTPEEVILDLGLNTTAPGTVAASPVFVQQRVILNYYTAKRMLIALQMTIQRHEENFGVLETDVRKRVQAKTPPPAKG